MGLLTVLALTAVSFTDRGLLAQGAGGGFLLLDPTTLKVVKTIK